MGCSNNAAISKFHFIKIQPLQFQQPLSSFIIKNKCFTIILSRFLSNIKLDSFRWAWIVQTLMGERQFGRWTKPLRKTFQIYLLFPLPQPRNSVLYWTNVGKRFFFVLVNYVLEYVVRTQKKEKMKKWSNIGFKFLFPAHLRCWFFYSILGEPHMFSVSKHHMHILNVELCEKSTFFVECRIK